VRRGGNWSIPGSFRKQHSIADRATFLPPALQSIEISGRDFAEIREISEPGENTPSAMDRKLPLLLLFAAVIAVAACLAIIADRRSHSPLAAVKNRLLYLQVSGMIPTNEPVVDVSEILSGPPFAGVVKNCIVSNVPGSRDRDPMEVVVIDIKRDDGRAFVMVAGPATTAEIDAAKRLAPGHTYEFPEALEISPDEISR
jgi:hypothetical protein